MTSKDPRAFLFSNDRDRPADAQNYLKRVLKPAAAKAGVPGSRSNRSAARSRR
jgi:hypothetical protein